jgi:hypothetical protein
MSTVRIQVRRGTASQWSSVNPILAAGEMGVESDTNLFKFGNGSSTWSALAYANNSDVAIGEISQDAVNAALSMGSGLTKTYNDGANTITISVDSDVVALKSYVDSQITSLSNTSDSTYLLAADLGQPNGVASLNSSGKLPASQLDIVESTQDTVNSLIVAGSGITKQYDDQGNTLTIESNISNGDGLVEEAGTGTERIFRIADSIHPVTAVQTGTLTADTVNASTIESTGNAQVGGNLLVNGDLTVSGTTTTINTTNYTVEDPMIYIGESNNSNILDLGFVAAFNDGTYQHSGLVRDASDGKWKLFSGVTAEPTSTVNFTTYTKDTLELGGLVTDVARIGDVLNTEIQHLSGVTSSIQTQLDAKLESVPNDSVTTSKIANLAVTAAKIAKNTITTEEIANDTITNANIDGNAAIDYAKLDLNNSIQTTDLIDAVISESKIAENAVTNSKVLNGTLTGIKLADGTISAAKLGTDSVTTSKITDGNVTEAKLAANSVTTGKIAQGTIRNEDINDSAAIENTKIAGTAVTLADTGTVTNTMLAGSIAQNKIIDLESDLAAKATIDAPTFTGVVTLPATTSIGTVSATEIGYVDGVTSAIQTQLDALSTADSSHGALTTNVHGIADTSLLATTANVATAKTEAIAAAGTAADTKVSAAVAALTKSSVGLGNVDNTSDASKPVSTAQAAAIATAKSEAIASATSQVTAVINNAPAAFDTLKEIADYIATDQSAGSALTASVALKAPIASPTFTGTVTVAAQGVAFTDGTQTKAGVPSITAIGSTRSASETLASGEQDKFVPISGAATITLPTSGYSTGQSIDFWQSSGTGAQFAGTGVVGTPGLKLRTTYSVATAMKIDSGWLVFGDLSA